MLEKHAEHEVERDSYTYQIYTLQQQLKHLTHHDSEHGSYVDVFVMFEKDVQRLIDENNMLRKENLRLESQASSFPFSSSQQPQQNKGNRVEDEDNDNGDQSQIPNRTTFKNGLLSYKAYQSKQQLLVDRLKQSGKEREHWKQEFESLKTKERKFVVAEKMLDDTTRRLRKTFHELQRLKKDYETQSVKLLHLERENDRLKIELANFEKAEQILQEEKGRLLSDNASLRKQVDEYFQEEQRISKLNRFLQKHSSPTRPYDSRKVIPNYSPLTSTPRINDPIEPIRQYSSLHSHHHQQQHHHRHSQQQQQPTSATKHVSFASNLTHQHPQHPQYHLHHQQQHSSSSSSATSLARDKKQQQQQQQRAVVESIRHSITDNAPALLPLFQQLANEAYKR
jgi:hypothetical protein